MVAFYAHFCYNVNGGYMEYVLVKGKKVNKKIHDLLADYYDLDDDNGICTITFTYANFTDFFDVSSAKKPILKGELRERIENVFLEIPNAYDLVFNVKISNYEGYQIKDANKAAADGFYLNLFKLHKTAKNKRLLSGVLLSFGVLTLLILILLRNFVLKDDTIATDIVGEVLDIASWVFIWEAVTVYFLDKTENKFRAKRITKRIKNINFI